MISYCAPESGTIAYFGIRENCTISVRLYAKNGSEVRIGHQKITVILYRDLSGRFK
jgi:hypothetical protein